MCLILTVPTRYDDIHFHIIFQGILAICPQELRGAAAPVQTGEAMRAWGNGVLARKCTVPRTDAGKPAMPSTWYCTNFDVSPSKKSIQQRASSRVGPGRPGLHVIAFTLPVVISPESEHCFDGLLGKRVMRISKKRFTEPEPSNFTGISKISDNTGQSSMIFSFDHEDAVHTNKLSRYLEVTQCNNDDGHVLVASMCSAPSSTRPAERQPPMGSPLCCTKATFAPSSPCTTKSRLELISQPMTANTTSKDKKLQMLNPKSARSKTRRRGPAHESPC